jgi:cell division protein FtsW
VDNFLKRYLKGDYAIWMVYFALALISIVEMFSASSQFVPKEGIMTKILQHAIHLAFGFVLLVIVHMVDSKTIKLCGYLGLTLSFCLLLYTSFKGLTADDGAARWLELGGRQFQPSEIAKLSLIIVVADWIDRAQNPEFQRKYFGWLALAICITCGLIMTENLSTAVILFAVVLLMMFIGSISIKRIMIFMGIIIGTVILIFLSVKLVPQEQFAEEYMQQQSGIYGKYLHTFKRVYVWDKRISEFAKKSDSNTQKFIITDDNRQIQHSQIAIAKGGIIGVMPGNSVQRNRLPEASNDFIFAIIVEELGMIGGIVVIFLYLVLLFRSGKIAYKSDTVYPAILVTGLSLMIVIQAFIHIGVAVGLGPVTGQPLPLISRGGTSILVNSIYFGVILGISRTQNNQQEKLTANQDISNNEEANNKNSAQQIVEQL